MNVLYHGRGRSRTCPIRSSPICWTLARTSRCAGRCPVRPGEETRNLVGNAVLERLGPAGYLINVSRGSVVDEPALLDALENGNIAGAALDVFASEPNIDPRLLAARERRAAAAFDIDHARNARRDARSACPRPRLLSAEAPVPRRGRNRVTISFSGDRREA